MPDKTISKEDIIRWQRKNQKQMQCGCLREHRYECKEFIDGITIADMLNEPYERVFKTLVTEGKGGGYFVFVIPIDQELDLKKAAKAGIVKDSCLFYVRVYR